MFALNCSTFFRIVLLPSAYLGVAFLEIFLIPFLLIHLIFLEVCLIPNLVLATMAFLTTRFLTIWISIDIFWSKNVPMNTM